MVKTTHVQSQSGMFIHFITLIKIREFLAYARQLSFGLGMFMGLFCGARFVVIRVLGYRGCVVGFLLLLLSAGFMLGTFITARIGGGVGVDRMIKFGSILSVISGTIMFILVLAGEWTFWDEDGNITEIKKYDSK